MKRESIEFFKKNQRQLNRAVSDVEEEYKSLLSDIFIENNHEIAGYVADDVNIGGISIYIESIWNCTGEWMIHGGTKDFEADIQFSSLSVVAMGNVIDAVLAYIEKESADENED